MDVFPTKLLQLCQPVASEWPLSELEGRELRGWLPRDGDGGGGGIEMMRSPMVFGVEGTGGGGGANAQDKR